MTVRPLSSLGLAVSFAGGGRQVCRLSAKLLPNQASEASRDVLICVPTFECQFSDGSGFGYARLSLRGVTDGVRSGVK